MPFTSVKPTAPAPPLPGQSTGVYPAAFPRPNFRLLEPIIMPEAAIISTVLWRDGDPPYDQSVPEPDFPLRVAIFEGKL